MISASSTNRLVGALTSDDLPAPTVGDLVVQAVSDGVWRVRDGRMPEHDALCVLGVIEETDGVYDALAVGRGLTRSTFASLDDPSLQQNICFLYHVIGGGTGDWDVPVGGMGAVTGELERVAREAGVEFRTGAEVLAVSPTGTVTYRTGSVDDREVHGDHVLANVAPSVLARLLPGDETVQTGPSEPSAEPEGAQTKVNLLLRRLPRLRDDAIAPEAAFGGTFHINESLTQLEAAGATALGGRVPDPLPAEIYCHSLADPSILGEGADRYQTLTLFGLQVPDRLVDAFGNDALRSLLKEAALASVDSVLDEPVEPLLAVDGNGEFCIEVKTTRDLENALAMPGGNIFHGPLSWPWAEPDDPLDTPARHWGVATGHGRILLCGTGSRRGGGVSGIGGHNAAMAVVAAG